MIATLALVWFQVWAPRRKVIPPEQAEQPSTMDDKPSSAVTPPPPPQKPQSKAAAHLARATWSRNPQSALRAIPIEPARGEVKTIELSRGETQVLVSVPKYNENGLTYSRYRVSLFASRKEIWRQTLRIPSVSLVGNAHVLNVALSSVRLPQSGPFDLKVEGRHKRGNKWVTCYLIR
jgi:hypothetical protein